ncbi:hypothetical protein [Planococcus koreensis]|uniref:hypothetical protein n=1 Tax=Planococcus koreensis TaxID=112331 RepID=UPI0039FC79D5
MYELSDELVQLGLQRIKGFPVDGFVRSRGAQNPALMLVGKRLAKTRLKPGFRLQGERERN